MPSSEKPRVAKGHAFLARLLADTSGNAIAIITAAVIPLVGMVGSAVDLSRAYMAQTRLQAACDAGVLGGRKIMEDSVDQKVVDEVRKLVNFNFPQGTMGTAPFAINPTEGPDNSVDLTLSTTVPAELVQVIGMKSFSISASCTAQQSFVNTDVMLVLDVTGSMNESINGTKKIDALREAVVALYKALEPAQKKLEDADLRLRYGIVPYSQTVNVGKLLYAKNPEWLREPHYYQQCTNWDGRGNCTAAAPVKVSHSKKWFKEEWDGCIEERDTVDDIRTTSGYSIDDDVWDLRIDDAPTSETKTKWAPYDADAVTIKAGSACPKAARLLAPFASEAELKSWLSASNGFLPTGSTYHDIGLIWGARLISPTGIWAGNNPLIYKNFPVQRHLIFMTDGELAPTISTYSAYGVEALDGRVTRASNYSTMQTEQFDSHLQRTRIMCNAIQSKSVTVWVIAFGTSLTQELKKCASSDSKAFQTNTREALIDRFREIGQEIGSLRLTR